MVTIRGNGGVFKGAWVSFKFAIILAEVYEVANKNYIPVWFLLVEGGSL